MVDPAIPGPLQLAALPGFAQLPPELLAAIAPRFVLQQQSMGEPLLLPDGLPATLFLLLSGELRQLVNHPSQPGRSLTLALHAPPFIAGWASLQAGQPLECLTAAADCTLLAIAAADWQQLLQQHPTLAHHAQQQLSPADLWPLLSHQADLPLPAAARDLRPWLRRLASEAQCALIAPGPPSQAALDPSLRWLVAASGTSWAYGSPVTPSQLPAVQAQLERPLRLIGLPQVLWAHALPLAPLAAPAAGSAPGRLDTPQATAEQAAPTASQEPEPEQEFHPSAFRFFSAAPGPVPEAIACFRTVAHQLRLPLKTDVLQRILDEQTSRGDGGVSLQLCAALAESLGLQTQLLNLPIPLIGRLQTPALVHLADGELAVALATRPGELLLARPRSAIEALTPAQLGPLASEEGTLPVLLLRTTERTPQKTFGLAWFLPSIRRNRRPLIEVLIASLFVQLFQLMNPLIVQQIIDKVIGQSGMS
ncbi:MAG: hypothetical protein VKM34_12835, partial [Cyanobacteriota bacterium]|nr:hypothetical protein [Cyanobacteriota bacterium]